MLPWCNSPAALIILETSVYWGHYSSGNEKSLQIINQEKGINDQD
jgi:hypothetical protein